MDRYDVMGGRNANEYHAFVQVVSVQLSRWQYTEEELLVPAVATAQAPSMSEGFRVRPPRNAFVRRDPRTCSRTDSISLPVDGMFSLIFSYLNADGFAMLENYYISAETGAVIEYYFMACTAGVGAFFFEKGNRQPE